MEIKKIIDSGLLETYVMGVATADETAQVLLLKEQSAEFEDALAKLEYDMEILAQGMAIEPPAAVFRKIEEEINEIQLRERSLKIRPDYEDFEKTKKDSRDRYIEVESESNQMRIHKAWRWFFAAVFILGKIFLATAIYFYLESKQAKEQIEELKTELQQNQRVKS
ncbi:hypothetical protein [Pedobacter frigidisoli]|uniref:hypothetical protein n=1 Tax=Pedobacter frigidisoli TaxID=2530455 RepID=UPI00292E6F46|nr:hypothetical protein [Pedobacter frigidisoli]